MRYLNFESNNQESIASEELYSEETSNLTTVYLNSLKKGIKITEEKIICPKCKSDEMCAKIKTFSKHRVAVKCFKCNHVKIIKSNSIINIRKEIIKRD